MWTWMHNCNFGYNESVPHTLTVFNVCWTPLLRFFRMQGRSYYHQDSFCLSVCMSVCQSVVRLWTSNTASISDKAVAMSYRYSPPMRNTSQQRLLNKTIVTTFYIFQFFPLNANFLFSIFYQKLILTFSLGTESFDIITFFEEWLGFSIDAFCLCPSVCLSVCLSVCCQSLNQQFIWADDRTPIGTWVPGWIYHIDHCGKWQL